MTGRERERERKETEKERDRVNAPVPRHIAFFESRCSWGTTETPRTLTDSWIPLKGLRRSRYYPSFMVLNFVCERLRRILAATHKERVSSLVEIKNILSPRTTASWRKRESSYFFFLAWYRTIARSTQLTSRRFVDHVEVSWLTSASCSRCPRHRHWEARVVWSDRRIASPSVIGRPPLSYDTDDKDDEGSKDGYSGKLRWIWEYLIREQRRDIELKCRLL